MPASVNVNYLIKWESSQYQNGFFVFVFGEFYNVHVTLTKIFTYTGSKFRYEWEKAVHAIVHADYTWENHNEPTNDRDNS